MKFKLREQITDTFDLDTATGSFYRQLFGKNANGGKLKAKNVETGEEFYLDVDYVSLLTKEEARQIEKDDNNRSKDDEILPARDHWWLRSESFKHPYAALVSSDGLVYSLGADVYCVSSVRPALYLENLESFNLKIGDICEINKIYFVYVLPGVLLAKDIVGKCAFRTEENCIKMTDCKNDDWREENKPYDEYKGSDVEEYIDDWFQKLKSQH